MLEPAERRLFLDALRPPEGYEVEHVIGATYSLDLTALLFAPLAFTMFEYADAKGELRPDPLALLEALRRHSGQISIFCQAGRMAVPRGHRLLHSFNEKSVFEVALPDGGAFHPKLWVLKFRREGSAPAWRVLVLTRNMTFDRCWDAMVVTDGTPGIRTTTRQGQRLAEFLRQMITFAREIPNDKVQGIRILCDELQSVSFEVPDGFESLDFRPILPGKARTWPFGTADRFAVVSPFLSQNTVSRFMESCRECLVISRIEALADLKEEQLAADTDTHCYYVTELAAPDDDEVTLSPDDDRMLSGLHAKIYVADDDVSARLWIGSANATESAFRRNVEFLVELSGRKKDCGVDALLNAPDGEASFRNMLAEFTPGTQPPAPESEGEKYLEEAWRLLAATQFCAVLTSVGQGFVYELSAADPIDLRNVQARCWPVTMDERAAVAPTGNAILARFENLALEAITPFVAFELTFPPTGEKRRFVVKAALHGVPEGRSQAILGRLLDSREQIVRYLLFLLSDELTQGGGTKPDATETNHTDGRSAQESPALLEALVRALAANPAKLDHVSRLLADLKTEEKPDTLKDLQTIWAPIAQAREALK